MKRLIIEVLMAVLIVVLAAIAFTEHHLAELNDRAAMEYARDVEMQAKTLERGRDIVMKLAEEVGTSNTPGCEQREF